MQRRRFLRELRERRARLIGVGDMAARGSRDNGMAGDFVALGGSTERCCQRRNIFTQAGGGFEQNGQPVGRSKGGERGLSLSQCKARCLETHDCTFLSYNTAELHCLPGSELDLSQRQGCLRQHWLLRPSLRLPAFV